MLVTKEYKNGKSEAIDKYALNGEKGERSLKDNEASLLIALHPSWPLVH